MGRPNLTFSFGLFDDVIESQGGLKIALQGLDGLRLGCLPLGTEGLIALHGLGFVFCLPNGGSGA